MTTQTAIKLLRKLSTKNQSDWEYAHEKADRILMQLLTDLGYNEVVIAYKKVGKWYA